MFSSASVQEDAAVDAATSEVNSICSLLFRSFRFLRCSVYLLISFHNRCVPEVFVDI